MLVVDDDDVSIAPSASGDAGAAPSAPTICRGLGVESRRGEVRAGVHESPYLGGEGTRTYRIDATRPDGSRLTEMIDRRCAAE